MKKDYQALELDKVLALLAEQTSFEDARQMALTLEPSNGLFEAKELLQETYDAHALSGRFGAPAFGNLHNMTNALRRAEAGAVLTTLELLRTAALLRVIRTVAEWRDKSASIETTLDRRFSALTPQKYLETKIMSAILSEEEIADNASPELANIRRKLAAAASRIRDRLDSLIRSTSMQKYLQDSIVTMRSGRYVVPVKAEFRSSVPGLVHDTSASGATVFIEPMSVVEANNEIRILHAKEQTEIDRILAELSAEVGACADSVCESYHILTELNVIFAKAHLAYKMKASLPVMNNSGRILLKKARHPLIPADKVVPTDVELGIHFDTLVVTGPNTGGKTVSLKTIGLLSLMAMCGLMIPAADNSELSVFDHVLVDIGDEQSIEQSLSTFSAHITNIRRILDEADEKSLVLIDELGAGTDPVEGAALATAILEKLRQQGAKIASTTHYAELKSFALDTKGVENACCEFDVATLRPTYKLLIGMPGRSNAFAISERLGIRSEVVERAKELVSHENTQFESVVQKLEESRHELEQRIAEADALKAEIKAERERMAAAEEEARQKQEKELENARLQAENIITKARAQVYGVLDEIEAIRRKKDVTAEEKAKLKADIRQMEDAADPIHAREQEEYHLPRPLKAGDNVLIFDIDKKAVVLETGKDSVLVQAGIIKTRVPLNNLRLLKEECVTTPKRSVTRTIRSDVKRTASTEVDVRGEVVLDALMDVDRAIDSAVMQGLHQITIIHGKGTGVLRKEIQAHLKKHPSVRSFRLGVFGEGDAGVTIAELK
ncbi:MAG: endonuclease MutS2 [Acutalibacteraceae bacterium]|nr:endonuclease MutS2 [Acutalibacteraceae bacterium]